MFLYFVAVLHILPVELGNTKGALVEVGNTTHVYRDGLLSVWARRFCKRLHTAGFAELVPNVLCVEAVFREIVAATFELELLFGNK